MPELMEPSHSNWTSRAKMAFAVFAIIGAFFLLLEHRAHVLPFLPFIFLAACPLMHLFMHGGHGGHGAHRDRGEPGAGRSEPSAAKPDDSQPGSLGSKGDSHHQHGGRS